MRVRLTLELRLEEGKEVSQDAIQRELLGDFIYNELWASDGLGMEAGYSVAVLPEVEFLPDPPAAAVVELPAEDVKA